MDRGEELENEARKRVKDLERRLNEIQDRKVKALDEKEAKHVLDAIGETEAILWKALELEKRALYSGEINTGHITQSVKVAVREEFLELREQEAGAQPKGFSKASSADATALLRQLQLDEINGNMMQPIDVPAGEPDCDEFDYSRYPNEDAGTPQFMDHHKQQLTKFGVKFGRGGYAAYDLHAESNMYSITTASGRQFSGTVDGSIAPYGLFPATAGRRSIVLYEHKQSHAQKQAYCDSHPELPKRPDSDSSGHVKYKTHRAQSVTAMLGAYAHTEYPVILDLTDGVVHHLLQIRGNDVCVWQNLSPQQAYYMQAEALKSVPSLVTDKNLVTDKKLRFNLEEILEEMQGPVKKARSALRPVSVLREQLDSVVPLVPPDERLACAHEIIASWIQAQPQAIPSSIMHMYA